MGAGPGAGEVALPSRGVEISAGLVVILMAAVFAGLGSRLQVSWRPRWMPPRGLIGAPLLGSVFALGWSPCVGPTLSAAMALISPMSASGADRVWAGAGLMTMYSMGLGLPFVVVATGWSRSVTAVKFLKRHRRSINLGGAVVLLAVGLMLVLGLWDDVTLWLRLNVALPTPYL